ncbi:MAG: efflux RND transporter periplasmic adaptor subunit [Hydrogenophaga sp.]|uniref:efflux RND transporter periplasmic adaptor subunit n=1 Tax=Hydrogenophaga sp. TaxID=1904254 RepID=UPI001D87491C|nr:efflux RND transporter periplasmic adaptor subunit [Hydrogenophaga sp.]MBX3610045.1 efflux RND transporter periplasmic adaptor subunit [Hydrogenophaga sp.]
MTVSRTRRLIYWLLPVLLVVALGLGVVRALGKRANQAEQAKTAAQALQTAPVYEMSERDMVRVRKLSLQRAIPVSGSIEALQTAVIKARVAGEVQGLRKREGDSVAEGEVVARIDPTDAQARVRQAAQQAESAQAQVRIAQRSLSNNQALVQQGFISATALETSQANLAAAEATHRAAVAALDIARKGLADTTLRAPIAGQVSARAVQNGERVGVDARVLEIVDLSAFEMEAALSPADAASVQVGQSARLQVEGLSTPLQATVARINPSVQAGSRSVLVYLHVPAQTGLRQGLFARGDIVADTVEAMAVPVSAVRNDRPDAYVQVVRDGVVRHVTLVAAPLGQVEGVPYQAVPMLAEGDVVLAGTAGAIRDGTQVKLPGATAPAAGN